MLQLAADLGDIQARGVELSRHSRIANARATDVAVGASAMDFPAFCTLAAENTSLRPNLSSMMNGKRLQNLT